MRSYDEDAASVLQGAGSAYAFDAMTPRPRPGGVCGGRAAVRAVRGMHGLARAAAAATSVCHLADAVQPRGSDGRAVALLQRAAARRQLVRRVEVHRGDDAALPRRAADAGGLRLLRAQ